MARRAPLLPRHSLSLYFWQVCLLAYMAGIACLHSFLLGASVLFCIAVADWPRLRRSVARILLLLLVFSAGCAVAQWNMPQKPDFSATGHAAFLGEKLRFEGTVERVDALPDARLRVILSNVRPVEGERGADLPPLPGLLVLTWQDAPVYPLPGQILAATTRIQPIRAFTNPGTYNSEDVWAYQNAWLRAWMRGDQARPELRGDGNFGTRLREELRSGLVAALLTSQAEERAEGQPFGPVGGQAAGQVGGQVGQGASRSRLSMGEAAIPALLFGDRFHLRNDELDLLGRATLVHSLALSGMHLGLAGLLGLWCALLAGRLFPKIYLHINKERLALACALPLGLIYLWLGNAPVSLVRAGLMLLFAGILLWLKRPRPLLDGLFLALLCMMLVSPLALFDLRLQLSAVAIAAIAVCLSGRSAVLTALRARAERAGKAPQPVVPGTQRPRAGRWLRAALGLFLATMCIQLIQLPLVLESFGAAGLAGILNVLWLPVLSCLVLPAAFMGFLVLHVPGLDLLAAWLFKLSAVITDGMLQALNWLDAVGMLLFPQFLRPPLIGGFGFYAVLAAAALLWQANAWRFFEKRPFAVPRNSMLLLAIGVFCLLCPVGARLIAYADPTVRLTMLDVSQGQSVLIEQGRHRFLLDAGGVAPTGFDTGKFIVAPVLTRNRPPILDFAVYSHPDVDHARGLFYIMEQFSVARLAGNGRVGAFTVASGLERLYERTGQRAEVWHAGQRYNFGKDVLVEVLHPPQDDSPDMPKLSSNNASLVLRFTREGQGLILAAGEVEHRVLRGLAASGADISAQVLLVPHHGSASSLSVEFYEAVNPALALVSCGFNNRWGFPKAVVTEALAERNIPLHSTADSGQLRLTFGKDGERVRIFFNEEYLPPR